MKSYFQLIKPRITFLILIVAMASFFLADRGVALDWKRLAVMTIATGLLACGIFALNAYLERDTDLLMRRTAARGTLEPGAWILSGILFLWQFPHFLAIEAMYRDDRERAGIRVLPVSEPTGTAAASVMVAALCLLLPLSAAPYLAGLSSRFALVGCLVVGVGFLSAGVLHALRKTPQSARVVLRSSLLYLPLVFRPAGVRGSPAGCHRGP